MQTTMVQLPQSSAGPVPGKAPSAKGRGLFEELLGENAQPSSSKPQGTDPAELLAAALAVLQAVPAVSADAGPAGAAEAQIATLAGAQPPGLQTLLALLQGQGQDPGQQSGPTLAAELDPQAAPGAQAGLAPELAPPAWPASTPSADSPAANLAPVVLPGENPAGPKAPALIPVPAAAPAVQAVVAALQPAAQPEAAAAVAQALASTLARPAADLPRGAKGPVAAATPIEQPPGLESPAAEPAAREGGKASGLSEARFAEMLPGTARPAEPNIPLRGAQPRGAAPEALNPEALKEPAVGGQPAADAGALAPRNEVAANSAPAPNLAAVSASSQPQPPPAPAAPAAPAPALQLSSGQSLPESAVLGQVLGRLQAGPQRQSGSISMKLHPEELGEVKLDLVVEKERVRALIVAQNQQVQEVLERHLPRLREALQQQGLKLEEVQVSVDARQQESGRGSWQQEQQAATQHGLGGRRGSVRPGLPAAEIAAAPAAPAQSGLSIRI